MTIKTNLLVVGGGPAGLSAAYAAAKKGVDVIVIERSNEIGYPIHTSGGSWIADLEPFGIDHTFYNPIHRFRLVSENYEAAFEFDPPVGCVMEFGVKSLSLTFKFFERSCFQFSQE